IRDPLVTGVQTCALPILSALPLAQLDEGIERVQVATPAQTGDLRDADGRDERFVAERLACVYIRHMYLDDRAVGILEGISQAVRSEERRVGRECITGGEV